MSDLNLKYTAVNNNTVQERRFSQQRLEAETLNRQSAEIDDKTSNKSMLKSYIDSLRQRSDDEAQKLLKTIENSPNELIGQLFGSVQIKSADQLGKMFSQLDPDKEGKDEGISAISGKKNAERADKLARADKIDKVDEVDKTDETDKTPKIDKAAQIVDKFIHDSISKESTQMHERSEKLVKASEKLKEAIEERHAEQKASDKTFKAAEDFVKSYNSLSDAIRDSKSEAVSGKAKFIEKMTKSFEKELNKVGIDRDENGDLTIDRKRFESASERDREEALSDKDSFTDFMEDQAKQLTAFAQKDIYQRASAYNNGGNVANISEIGGAYFNMFG